MNGPLRRVIKVFILDAVKREIEAAPTMGFYDACARVERELQEVIGTLKPSDL